jgi:predicted transcriptional regulator
MEPSREQITQALEFCSNCECNNDKTQAECPLINMPFCKNYLRKQSLALIKELTEENEKLNKRFEREARCQYDLCGQIVNLRDDVKYIKEETVRQIQDRMVMHFGTYTDKTEIKVVYVFKLVEQIAEEILED